MDKYEKYKWEIETFSEFPLNFSYLWVARFFDNNSIQQLELVRKAKTVESMADLANRGDLSGIIIEIRNVIDASIKQLNQDITDPLFDMPFKINTIETNLREYQDSIKMDSQFYL